MDRQARLRVVEAPSPQEAMQEAVESFLQRGQARNLSHHTLRYYRVRLDAFTQYLEANRLRVSPEQVTPALVRELLAAEAERVSALTASHSFISLRALFRFLVREEAVESNPMERVEKVRVPRKVIQTFSYEQIEQMLATCNGRSFNGLRLRAIILTLLDCGLRVSELCGLTVEDVSWDEGTLRVMGKGSKERVVPFGEATRQTLLAYVARRGELPGQSALFVTCYGDRMNRQEVHRILRDCGKRAGVTGVRCSAHTFRHTCAVMYLRNGGDAFSLQKLLGHSDLAMTRRYCELSQTDALQKHRQCSPGDRFLSAVRPTRGRKRLR
jgi:site-specific recombinase XerD